MVCKVSEALRRPQWDAVYPEDVILISVAVLYQSCADQEGVEEGVKTRPFPEKSQSYRGFK